MSTVQIFIKGEIQYSTNVDPSEVESFISMRIKELSKKFPLKDISYKVY